MSTGKFQGTVTIFVFENAYLVQSAPTPVVRVSECAIVGCYEDYADKLTACIEDCVEDADDAE